MSSADPLTSVAVRRGQLYELRRIALDLSRAEGRRVTLGDVIGRLLSAWEGRSAPDAGRQIR